MKTKNSGKYSNINLQEGHFEKINLITKTY